MRPSVLLLVSLVACGGARPSPIAAAPPGTSTAPPAAAPAPAPSPDASTELRTLATPGLDAISPSAISAHIRYLADDLLEGRGTGQRGFELAARYVATELQAMDVAPAGDSGTYFQTVHLRGMTTDPAKTRFSVSRQKARLDLSSPGDVLLSSDGAVAAVDVSAPLVFVGYGITAPEFHYDDLAGVDLKGKIAVYLYGAPLSERHDFFPPAVHASYADADSKLRNLVAHGAIGVIRVMLPEDEKTYPWSFIVNQSHFERMAWMDGDEPGDHVAGVPLRAGLSGAAFGKLLAFAKAPVDVAALAAQAGKNALKSFDLGVSVAAHGVTTMRAITSENVVGVLAGSDPSLAHEYVVYTAHLDHLGVGSPIEGDAIYNGADDDASGVATVLEIARGFRALPKLHPRSVVFLLTTGEEKGLLGAAYFAAHPTVYDRALVADVNIDGNSPIHEVHDVVALGAEHSSLAGPVTVAAAAFGLRVSPDPDPSFNAFVRSDQYPFVKKGVPSVFIFDGDLDASGSTKANEAAGEARAAKRYHKPADEWDSSLDYRELAKMARVDLLLGLAITRAEKRPTWNAGDFYERFAR